MVKGSMASHFQKVAFFVRGHDKSRLMGVASHILSSWYTPWKINIQTPKNWRFDSDDFPFQTGDFPLIFCFQPLIFQPVGTFFKHFPSGSFPSKQLKVGAGEDQVG